MANYTQAATLTGHEDGVLSLSFSVCGRYLAATGYAGVRIWDVATHQSMNIPTFPAILSQKHVFTKSIWLHLENTGTPILALGSMYGDVTLWKLGASQRAFRHVLRSRSDAKSETLSMDVLRRSVPYGERGRIAISTEDGRILVWSLSSAADQLQQDLTIRLDASVHPKTIRFHAPSRSIIAFSSSGGLLSRFDYDTGVYNGCRRGAPNVMASVVLDSASSTFAAYTGSSIEIQSVNQKMRIMEIACETPVIYYPMYLAFGEGGRVLLAGTDRGRALLYDTGNGNVLQVLHYSKGGLVQQVATCSTIGSHFLAIAGSSIRRPADVIIFSKTRKVLPAQRNTAVVTPYNDMRRRTSACEYGVYIIVWILMLATLIYLLMNTLEHKLNT